MTAPNRYSRGYSFSGFQANSPNRPLPGNKVDGELDNVEQSINDLANAVADIRRDDGALKNGIVTKDALAPGLSTGVDPATLWTSGIAYTAENVVFYEADFYRCVQSHVSNADFTVDLAAGRWVLFANFSQYFSDAAEARDEAEVAAAAALVSQNAAATSAGTAAAAASTATTAASTATAAANSATTAYDLFDSRYLGEKTSLPTLGNDGGALVDGAFVSLTGQANPEDNGMYIRRNGGWTKMYEATDVYARLEVFSTANGNLTGGQTVFTVTGGYNAGYAQVFKNGVKLVSPTDVSISSGTTFTLTAPVTGTDVIDFVGFRVVNLSEAIPDLSITTAKIADNNITDAKIASVSAAKLTGTIPDLSLPQRMFPTGSGVLPQITNPTDENRFGGFYYEGSAITGTLGYFNIFPQGDRAGNTWWYARDLVNRITYRAIDTSTGSLSAWERVFETNAELLAAPSLLRKTSSGDISTADSALLDHSGNTANASANAAILNQMLSDINAAGGGVLRLNRGTIATTGLSPYSNQHIAVRGLGERISNLIMTGTSGNLFTINQNSQGFRTHFEGFSALKHSDGSTVGAVIRANYPSVTSSLNNTLIVKHVEGRGAGTAFGAVVVPENAWNMILENIEGEGISGAPSTMVATIAPRGKCTVAHMRTIKGFWQQAVVDYEAGFFSEGIRISGLHGVAVNRLVNLPDLTDAPGVYISDSHGETFDYGLYILNASQVQLRDVHLYKRITSTSNWVGVWMEANGLYAGNSLTANGLMIGGFRGATAGGTATGIFCDDVNGIAGHGNEIEDCDLGAGFNNTCTGQFAFTHRNLVTVSSGTTGMTISATAA